MDFLRTSSFRPIPAPDIPLPFGLRSVGHGRVGPGWKDNPIRKDFIQLFWGVEGRCRFILDGAPTCLPPCSVFLYFPGDTHRICAETDWEYRWMTIDGPLCRETVEALGLVRGTRMHFGF
jgi:hypothetical protein